jgi:hypothetical protein
VVVGDENGTVGVGCASAGEVIQAVRKAATDARRNSVTVPLNKNASFPHRIDGIFGAAKVRLHTCADASWPGKIVPSWQSACLLMTGSPAASARPLHTAPAAHAH